MKAGDSLNTLTTNNGNREKGKKTTFESKSCPVNQQFMNKIDNWSEDSKKGGSIVDKKDEGHQETMNEIINSHNVCISARQTSLVPAQPVCSKTVMSRTLCMTNRHTKTRLSSSEVLAAILEGDTSDSDCFDSPQKNIIQGKLQQQTYYMDTQEKDISNIKGKKILHILDDGKNLEENMISRMKYRLQENQIEQVVSSSSSNQDSPNEKYKLQKKNKKQRILVNYNQDSEDDLIPTKKSRFQEKDVQQFPQNNDHGTVSEVSYGHHRSDNQRNVTDIFKELRCQNITDSPYDSCSTDSSVEILGMNNPKTVHDSVIEISSDSDDDCVQMGADVLGSSSCHSHHKEEDQLNCMQRDYCNVMECNSNCENSKESSYINVANNQLKRRANSLPKRRTNIWQKYVKRVQLLKRANTNKEMMTKRTNTNKEMELIKRTNTKKEMEITKKTNTMKELELTKRTNTEEESEVCLLSESDCHDSSATELDFGPLLGTVESLLKDDAHIFGRKCNQENNNLVSNTRQQENPDSDDSFTSSYKITKRNRLKKATRIFDSSDSEHGNIESCWKTSVNKNKSSAKNVAVEIKIVGKKCKGIDEIKYGALSDLDIIENLDKLVSRSKKDVKEKSVSGTFGQCNQQKTTKQERSGVIICQSNSNKNNQSSRKVTFKCNDYHFQEKACMSPLGLCILDSESEDDIPLSNLRDDEDDIPLSNLRSHEDDISLCNLRCGSFAPGTNIFNKRPILKTYTCPKVRMQNIQKGFHSELNSLSSFNSSTCVASDNVRNEAGKITNKSGNKVDSCVCKINGQAGDEVNNSSCKTIYQAGDEVNNSSCKTIYQAGDEVNNSSCKTIYQAGDEVNNSSCKTIYQAGKKVDISASKVNMARNERGKCDTNISISKKDPFDFSESDDEMSSSNVFLGTSRNATFNSTEDFEDSNVYKLYSSGCDNEEHYSVTDIQVQHQENDSDETSSKFLNISSVVTVEKCDKENKLTSMNQTKPLVSSELYKLRVICRTLGLVLRNTRELAGCVSDEDKIQRIKLLLEEKGMKGKPSLQKAERLLLLKEVKELQCEKVTSSQEKYCSRRKTRENFTAQSETSQGKQQNVFDKYIHNMFSGLRDIVTVESSDSA